MKPIPIKKSGHNVLTSYGSPNTPPKIKNPIALIAINTSPPDSKCGLLRERKPDKITPTPTKPGINAQI